MIIYKEIVLNTLDTNIVSGKILVTYKEIEDLQKILLGKYLR